MLLASVTAVPVSDNNDGWTLLSDSRWPYERQPAEAQALYRDGLQAWRNNPLAKRAIDVVTDFVVGDGIELDSEVPTLAEFIALLWGEPQNRETLGSLHRLSDELNRAGDLFLILFPKTNGVPIVRAMPKDRISRIETAENDWTLEMAYIEPRVGGEDRVWKSQHNPTLKRGEPVCVHLAINRPVGALMGEGDLGSTLGWLADYAVLLKQRVNLHKAMRSYYWDVTVPSNKVQAKAMQYARPPSAGSIIVHDEAEKWQAVTPDVKGADASHDLAAVRRMVYTAGGIPGIWMGEAGSTNLAEAEEMRGPAERHLKRRQDYLVWGLQELVYHAYRLARLNAPARWAGLPSENYSELFTVQVTEVSRADNLNLAQAGKELAAGLAAMGITSPALQRRYIALWFKFIGEPLGEDELDEIMAEVEEEATAVVGEANGVGVNDVDEEEEAPNGVGVNGEE